MRVCMIINDELLKRIDEEAKKYNVNRTAFVTMAVTSYLNQQEITKQMPEMFKSISATLDRLEALKKGLPQGQE